jgi:hypothetical protein
MRIKLILLICFLILLVSCNPNTINFDKDDKEEPDILQTSTPLKKDTQEISQYHLPKYLGVVFPEPESQYTLSEYRDLAESLGWDAASPGICFSISPYYFMEPGDFPTVDQWLRKVVVSVDEEGSLEYSSVFLTDSVGIYYEDSESGEILWKEPAGSPLRPCYSASIDIGHHTVRITVRTTSGKQESFNWSFEIVE